MLKERTDFIRNVFYVLELMLVSALFFGLYYAMLTGPHHLFGYTLFPEKPHPFEQYLKVFWLVLAVWAVILKIRGEGHRLRTHTSYKILTTDLINGLIFFCVFASGAFVFKLDFISRLFMAMYTLGCVSLIFGLQCSALMTANYIRSKGYNYQNLLVVGTGRRSRDFLRLLGRHKEWGYRVVGLLDQDPAIVGQNVDGYKVMGILDDLPTVLENNVIDQVVFVVPRNWIEKIEKYILHCEAVGVPVTLSTNFFNLQGASGVPQEVDGFTYLTFETRLLKEPELFVKRTLDIVLSMQILATLLPLFVFVAALVRFTSKGPVFFRQERCGRNGRKFMLYKFRSMVPDAEQQQESLRALNEMSGPVFKITNDPRMTKVGKFLRKTSLDELPQLWNVLRGDMSLVGPRPPLPSEVAAYKPWQRRRLSMKPGITCIWQVSGRNDVSFQEWMKMDLQYIDRWSLWLDVKIILQTVRVVLTAHGAR